MIMKRFQFSALRVVAILLVLLTHISVLASDVVAESQTGEKRETYERRGIYDGPAQALAMVARTPGEYQKMIRTFGADLLPPMPDFNTQMIVAISMGQRRTGGYSVTILGIEERNRVLYVRYRERVPKKDELVTQALTAPYHIKVLPHSDATKVLFEKIL